MPRRKNDRPRVKELRPSPPAAATEEAGAAEAAEAAEAGVDPTTRQSSATRAVDELDRTNVLELMAQSCELGIDQVRELAVIMSSARETPPEVLSNTLQQAVHAFDLTTTQNWTEEDVGSLMALVSGISMGEVDITDSTGADRWNRGMLVLCAWQCNNDRSKIPEVVIKQLMDSGHRDAQNLQKVLQWCTEVFHCITAQRAAREDAATFGTNDIRSIMAFLPEKRFKQMTAYTALIERMPAWMYLFWLRHSQLNPQFFFKFKVHAEVDDDYLVFSEPLDRFDDRFNECLDHIRGALNYPQCLDSAVPDFMAQYANRQGGQTEELVEKHVIKMMNEIKDVVTKFTMEVELCGEFPELEEVIKSNFPTNPPLLKCLTGEVGVWHVLFYEVLTVSLERLLLKEVETHSLKNSAKRLTNLTTAKVKQLQEEILEHKAQITQLQEEISEHKDQVTQLQTQELLVGVFLEDSFQETQSKIVPLEASCQALLSTLQAAMAEVQILQRNNQGLQSALKTEIQRSKSTTEQLHDLSAKHAVLREEKTTALQYAARWLKTLKSTRDELESTRAEYRMHAQLVRNYRDELIDLLAGLERGQARRGDGHKNRTVTIVMRVLASILRRVPQDVVRQVFCAWRWYWQIRAKALKMQVRLEQNFMENFMENFMPLVMLHWQRAAMRAKYEAKNAAQQEKHELELLRTQEFYHGALEARDKEIMDLQKQLQTEQAENKNLRQAVDNLGQNATVARECCICFGEFNTDTDSCKQVELSCGFTQLCEDCFINQGLNACPHCGEQPFGPEHLKV
jgi:hypothetical protein